MNKEFLRWLRDRLLSDDVLFWEIPPSSSWRRIRLWWTESQLNTILDCIHVGDYEDVQQAFADGWNLTRDEQALILHNLARWQREWQAQQEADHESAD